MTTEQRSIEPLARTSTVRTGLVGAGIKRSRSPFLHESEGGAQGLDLRYSLFDLDDEPDGSAALPAVLDRIQQAGLVGANVTFPVKQAVMPLLDTLSPEAEALGAVNTVRFTHDGRREGHNTDWWGFGENLRQNLGETPSGRVVVLGAGGAGSAAAYALGRMGVEEILIFDTDAERAAEAAARLAGLGFPAIARPLTELAAAMRDADGLVHATPTGMAKHPGTPVPAALLRPSLWVAEIVYVPLETELLRLARAAGCRAVDGGGMVVLQAARAFEIFTGLRADQARMAASFAQATM